MTPTDEVTTFPGGPPRGVDLPGIERQLRELWRSAGAEAGEGGVVRAALLNLIVMTPPQGRDIGTMVAAVSAELPCRALVLETNAAGGESPVLEAWISAHCRPAGPGRKQVCCEQVTIRVAPAGLAGLASTLLGLLLPDLPTVLLAVGQPELDGPLLARLAHFADRLVVDSAQFAAPAGDLARLARWATDETALEVADLTWPRLEAWRELLAALFDAPPFDAALALVHAVEIEHDAGARAEALLAAGWLASRLGWQPRRGAGDEVELASPTGAVLLRLRTAAGPAPASPTLRRVSLDAAPGTRFVVAADAQHPTLLESRIETDASCPLPQRLDRKRLDADAELLQVLMRGRRNVAFEAALAAAARLFAPARGPA